MAENIYEKLGRIENKVDAILPPRYTVDAMIEKKIKNTPQRNTVPKSKSVLWDISFDRISVGR